MHQAQFIQILYVGYLYRTRCIYTSDASHLQFRQLASIVLTPNIYSSGIQRLYNRHLTLLYPSFQLLFSAILNVYICVSFCLSCYYIFLLLCFHSHRHPDENNAFSAVQICKVSISQQYRYTINQMKVLFPLIYSEMQGEWKNKLMLNIQEQIAEVNYIVNFTVK